MSRAVDGGSDDDLTDAEEALETYGAVYAGSSSSRTTAHPHPKCKTLTGGRNNARQVTHPAEMPLRVTDVCKMCKRSYIDDDGNLLAHDGTDQFEPYRPTEYDCATDGCDRSAVVEIEHPEHGEVTACAVHQRRHPVTAVLTEKPKYHDTAWLRDQYLTQGRSSIDIAEDCDVYPQTIRKRLRRSGIPTRTKATSASAGERDDEQVRECDYGSCRTEAILRISVSGNERAVCGEHHESATVIGVTGDREKGGTEQWLRHQCVTLGRSTQEIADICDTPRTTIQYRLREYNIPTRPRGGWWSGEAHNDPDWLREEYWANGRSLRDLADECGVAKSSIRRRMDKFGIERRPPNGVTEGGE
jgi:DNA-directed RNA polymerase specialized sigma24 family protein